MIAAIASTTAGFLERRPQPAPAAAQDAPAAETAGPLVPLEPAAPAPPRLPRRVHAGLIVQLIAHAEDFEWTRERRRAPPEVATAAYRASAAPASPRKRPLAAA